MELDHNQHYHWGFKSIHHSSGQVPRPTLWTFKSVRWLPFCLFLPSMGTGCHAHNSHCNMNQCTRLAYNTCCVWTTTMSRIHCSLTSPKYQIHLLLPPLSCRWLQVSLICFHPIQHARSSLCQTEFQQKFCYKTRLFLASEPAACRYRKPGTFVYKFFLDDQI